MTEMRCCNNHGINTRFLKKYIFILITLYMALYLHFKIIKLLRPATNCR